MQRVKKNPYITELSGSIQKSNNVHCKNPHVKADDTELNPYDMVFFLLKNLFNKKKLWVYAF